MQARHLVATAERVAVLGRVHLVLVRQALEVSAIGRCSAGAGLLLQLVAVGWHLVQRAGVGDAAVPVGRHLGIVRGGVALGVATPVGLRRELRIVRCVLGGVTTRSVVVRGAGELGSREARGWGPGGAGSAAEARLSVSSHGSPWRGRC